MRPALLLTAALFCAPAAAQTPPEDTSPALKRDHTTILPSVASPAAAAYDAAIERMHRALNIPFSGDADRDFVAILLVQTQGAIDLARVELQRGRDPQLRKLAQDLIAASERDLAVLRQWQAAPPK